MAVKRIINAMFGRGSGGIEQAFLDYNEALMMAGYEVHALIHPGANVAPALARQGVAAYAVGNWGAWDVVAIYRLRRLLAGLSPLLCIAHGNRALSLLTKTRVNMPIVAVAHNYKINFTGKMVFCPTHDLMRYAQKQGARTDALWHIPNMVREVGQSGLREMHRPPVIGALGRMVAKKGFATFIEALAMLQKRGRVFRAVLAGDGEEAAALKALAHTRGLEDILSLPGWVEESASFFAAIDIFCLPSLHEPFGIALLEAMAHGLPVVAADSEGPSEILHSGEDGLLVPKGDAAALADAFDRLLGDPALAHALGMRARAKVETHYALPVIAAKLDLAVTAAVSLNP